MGFLTTIPLLSLFLIILGAWVFLRSDAFQGERISSEVYPEKWSGKKRWVVTILWILAIGLYCGSFLYGVINILESGDPFTGHHLYHLIIGGIIIFLFLAILFFFIGAYVVEWGAGLKVFFTSIAATVSVMGVISLGFYLLLQSFNLPSVFLALISSFLVAGVSVSLLALLLYFLFSRK